VWSAARPRAPGAAAAAHDATAGTRPSVSAGTAVRTPCAGDSRAQHCRRAEARRSRTAGAGSCLVSTVSGHDPGGGVEEDTVGSCAPDENVVEFAKAGFNLVVAQLVREAADDTHRSRERERVIDRVPEVD